MRTPFVMLASVALIVSACGGDDDSTDAADVVDSDVDVTEVDVDAGGAPSTEESESNDGSAAPATVPEVDSDDGDQVDLDELQSSVEDAVTDFNTGEGGGTVTVNGVSYTFEAQVCIVQQPDVSIEGPATGDDGSAAWVSVSRSVMDREQATEILGEQAVDMMFGDRDTLDEASVAVSVGQTDMFGAGATDADPSWNADNGVVVDLGASLTVELTDNAIEGSGAAIDSNSVAVEWGETVPIEFTARCG